MIQDQRQEKILAYLADHEYLTVEEAMTRFGASGPTIRRDFAKLDHLNLAQRCRGGLKVRKATRHDIIPPFALRQLRQAGPKQVIARRAVDLLEPGHVITIDGGTTTFHMGASLPDISLRVITNSLRLVWDLETRHHDRPNIEITLTGGLVYKDSGILLGPVTRNNLTNYHADLAFLSASGITEQGIYNTNELVAETERVMIQRADRVVILVDHTKFNKKSMCHVCELDHIHTLITDRMPEGVALAHTFKEAGVEAIEAGIR